jgi:hypothetical protein
MRRILAALTILAGTAFCQTPVDTKSILAEKTNGVYDAMNFPGADFSLKVNACLAALEAAGGGTCDARNFPISNMASETITVGDGAHLTTLLLPVGTVIFAAGKQLVYRAYSSIMGQGGDAAEGARGSNIVCTNLVASCVQSFDEPAGQLFSANLSNFDIGVTGTHAPGSVGLQLAGAGYVDVLQSHFSNISIGGADIGTLLDSVGGCICYNTFNTINSYGTSIGIRSKNDSGYFSGVNSNQWTGGRVWAPIGLFDTGSGKFTYNYLDFESNRSSTGAILYAGPDGYNAGANFKIGDTVRPAGGDSTSVLTVAAVSGGAVTALNVTAPGASYSNAQSVATSTLSGSGSGLRVDLRVSAYMVLASHGGVLVHNPYEEAGSGDYICGVGNYVEGAWASGNGGVYQPTYCTGPTNGYGGPASNFVWGSGSAPASIGLNGNGSSESYIGFGLTGMFDGNYPYSYHPALGGTNNNVNLFSSGPAWNGAQSRIFGFYGHSTWDVGLSKPHSGTFATGKTIFNQLPNPTPTLTARGGTGTTSSSYGLVCNDANGGTTLPSTPSATVNGPATLGALLTIAVVNGGSGYVSGDVGTSFTIHSPTTGSGGVGKITSVSGGAVTGVSLIAQGANYNTLPFPGGGAKNVFTTSGGTGSGLTVAASSSYIQIAYPIEDGCNSWTVLIRDTTHQLKTEHNAAGSMNLSADIIDFGNGTIPYSPGSRNTTGDVSVAGKLTAGGSPVAVTVAKGSLSLAASPISPDSCQAVIAGTVNSAKAVGVVSADVIAFTPDKSIHAVAGYASRARGGLTITAYPTAGFVNFDVCNGSRSAITPGAVTLNWIVSR